MKVILDTNVVLDVLLEAAMRSKIVDFEDAVIEQAGHQAHAEAIVTRNSKDFLAGRLKVLDPSEFLALLRA